MKYKAIVKNKDTKESEIIESEYNSKSDFIKDLRANGYSVNSLHVKESSTFDWIMNNTNCNKSDWEG